MEIKGRTVFISGASAGIGKACAQRFAELGCTLFLAARRFDRLSLLSQELSSKYGINCTPIELDVRINAQVESVFKNLEVDILINNAGLGLSLDKLQDGQISHWETMIDTNLKGLLYTTKAALASMIRKNSGHIINMGSIAGRHCYTGGNVYCATKHALKAINQSLRFDLQGTAIRVSEIAPGAVHTEFSEVRFNDKERATKMYEGYHPLLADDIADAVIYCATRPLHVNVEEIVIYPQAQVLTNFTKSFI